MSEKLQSIAGISTAGTGSSSPVPDGSGESEDVYKRQAQAPAANTGDSSGGFTGYEPFGGNSFFDDQN